MLLNIIELNTKYYEVKDIVKIRELSKKNKKEYNENKYIQRIICLNKLKLILYKVHINYNYKPPRIKYNFIYDIKLISFYQNKIINIKNISEKVLNKIEKIVYFVNYYLFKYNYINYIDIRFNENYKIEKLQNKKRYKKRNIYYYNSKNPNLSACPGLLLYKQMDECKKIIKDMNLQLISKKYVIIKKDMVNDLHFYYNKKTFRDVYSILIL